MYTSGKVSDKTSQVVYRSEPFYCPTILALFEDFRYVHKISNFHIVEGFSRYWFNLKILFVAIKIDDLG